MHLVHNQNYHYSFKFINLQSRNFYSILYYANLYIDNLIKTQVTPVSYNSLI